MPGEAGVVLTSERRCLRLQLRLEPLQLSLVLRPRRRQLTLHLPAGGVTAGASQGGYSHTSEGDSHTSEGDLHTPEGDLRAPHTRERHRKRHTA
eukprot:3420039-Pyramimonas_sp.AAC.1